MLNTIRIRPYATPRLRAILTEFSAYSLAVSTSPRPKFWEVPISEPMRPIIKSAALSHINIPPNPPAATDVTAFSMRPNQNMSVRLYVICNSWVPMIGKATISSLFRMSPWVRSYVFPAICLLRHLPGVVCVVWRTCSSI